MPDAAMSIDEWCTKWRFSRAYYYVLKKRGKAPREFRIGRAVRITAEADLEWERAQQPPVAALVVLPPPPVG